MTDPYCWPGTDCLANKLGLRDAAALRDAEFRLVSIRDVQAARTIIPGNYGLGHLQAFHRHLFGDLYKWAGQTRTVDISKPARFCHWRFIDDQVSTVLTGLSEDGFLLGLRREAFVESLAHYYGEHRVALSIYLCGQLYDAAHELHRLNPYEAPSPQVLFARFVGWARPCPPLPPAQSSP
ncbi:hypothetical protein ABZX66_11675 [Micromonospora aurantiaca]|uniref:Fic/DOC family protein n=1 Tax=Micromonospora aurantiaca (nom. illeg.) TaxID=47850 RepID=UPI0033A0FC8A